MPSGSIWLTIQMMMVVHFQETRATKILFTVSEVIMTAMRSAVPTSPYSIVQFLHVSCLVFILLTTVTPLTRPGAIGPQFSRPIKGLVYLPPEPYHDSSQSPTSVTISHPPLRTGTQAWHQSLTPAISSGRFPKVCFVLRSIPCPPATHMLMLNSCRCTGTRKELGSRYIRDD